MKKGLRIGLAVVMIVSVMSLGLIGCAKEEPTPTKPTPVAPAPTPAPEEVYKLKYSFGSAVKPGYPFGERLSYLIAVDSLEAASDGRIDIDVYGGGSLHAHKKAISAVRSGITDVSTATPMYEPEYLPFNDVWCLPGLYLTSEEGVLLYCQTFKKFFKKDFDRAGIVNLTPSTWSAYVVFSVKKPVRTVEDFKGLTIRVAGKVPGMLMEELGAMPITVPYMDIYEALSKGIIEAVTLPILWPYRLHHTDLGKPGYLSICGLPGSATASVTRPDVIDSLPPDLQEIFKESWFYWQTWYFNQCYDAQDSLLADMYTDAGIEVIRWSYEDRLGYEPANEAVYEWFYEQMEEKYGRGDEARAYVETIKRLYTKLELGPRSPLPPEVGKHFEGYDEAAWKDIYLTTGMPYKGWCTMDDLPEEPE